MLVRVVLEIILDLQALINLSADLASIVLVERAYQEGKRKVSLVLANLKKPEDKAVHTVRDSKVTDYMI